MPAPLTPADARVVDRVLTTVARGYRPGSHAWPLIFPVVRTGQRAGQIIEFRAEDFVAVDIRRAPGEDRKEVQYGYAGKPYATEQRALDGKVPVEVLEDARVSPGIDHQRLAVMRTMHTVSLQIELAAAALATNVATYENDHIAMLSGAGQWDHVDSSPAKRVRQAKETIAEAVGIEPNLMVLGPLTYNGLAENQDVIDRVKYTDGLQDSGDPIINERKLASYFDIPTVFVPRVRSGAPGAFFSPWGRDAWMGYSSPADLAMMGSPSYGYTYRLAGYPVAQPGYYDAKKDSWIFPVTTEDTPVVAGAVAGFLFKNAVSQ